VRARGLKLAGMLDAQERAHVAPRAGAWIETANPTDDDAVFGVAPRAGAWIETFRS